MRSLKPAALACLALPAVALLAACESADHEVQMQTIQGDVEQTYGGDVGALIYHGYEAARLAEAADAARAQLASLPSYSPASTAISNEATDMADQAAEHRRQADAALNRILDPLRERIAKLEEAQSRGEGASAASAVDAVLRFPAGSARLPAEESAKLRAVAQYLALHPRAQVTITGWPDGSDDASNRLSRARADAAYAALSARGLPPETAVAITAAGPGGDPPGAGVEIRIRPSG